MQTPVRDHRVIDQDQTAGSRCPVYSQFLGVLMHHSIQKIAGLGLALVFSVSAQLSHASLIENHVVVSPTSGQAGIPPGYDEGYSMRLGTGVWEYPYVDLFVDRAEGQTSYASLGAGPSYLTYIQEVSIVQVQAGDEISARTLTDDSLPSFVSVKRLTAAGQPFDVTPLISPDGNSPDIYLGFSYTNAGTNAGTQNPSYGWVHLRYTQTEGLSVVSSAMTRTDGGIFALTTNTVPAIPEASTTAMMMLGLAGIVGLGVQRRHRQALAA